MRKWNFRVKDLCPFCMSEVETTTHILHCQQTDAMEIWYSSLVTFRNTLERLKTEPTLVEALIIELDLWRGGLPFPPIHNYPSTMQQVILELRDISYDQVLEGLLPKSLIHYQHTYFQTEELSKYTGKNWGKKVYKACWTLIKALWVGRNEHLHKTDRIHELQGLPLVIDAIKAEYQLGLHRLPACEFSIYFSTPIEEKIKQPLENLRIWLLTIRLGRQLHGGIDHIQDDFSQNGPARSWLGLQKLQQH